jgi:hypothetical protein
MEMIGDDFLLKKFFLARSKDAEDNSIQVFYRGTYNVLKLID